MMRSTEFYRGLLLRGSLQCRLNGAAVAIQCHGSRTVIDVPDIATGLQLLQLGSLRDSFVARSQRFDRLLSIAQHRVDLTVAGRTVAECGQGVHSWAGRVLGCASTRVRPIAILKQALRFGSQ